MPIADPNALPLEELELCAAQGPAVNVNPANKIAACTIRHFEKGFMLRLMPLPEQSDKYYGNVMIR